MRHPRAPGRDGDLQRRLRTHKPHSLQINGENYLMPVEFEPQSATVERDLVSINDAIARLAAAVGLFVANRGLLD
jgi:hypothetical protein